MSETPDSPEVKVTAEPESPKPAKKGRLKKVALGLVVVVAAVALVGRAMLPGIIRGKVEEKGSAALGVPVTVGDLGFSILSGSLTIKDFAIAQPAGFSSEPLYSFEKFHASLSVTDLMGGKVTVETVQVDKPVLRIERNSEGKKNYEIIQANAEKNTPKDTTSGKGDSNKSEEEKEVLLKEFIVRDLQVVLADATAGTITFDQKEYSVRNVHMVPGSKEPAWFTLEWKGLALSGPGGKFQVQKPFTLESMTMEIDLASLMANDPHIKSIRVVGPEIRSEQLADSTLNLIAMKDLAMLFGPTPTDEAGAIPENERTDTKTSTEGGVEVEQAPYRLDLLEVTKGLVVQTLTYDSGPQDFMISGLTVDARDLASPAPAGTQSQVTVRMNPLAPDSTLALKLLGNLTTTVDADRDITYDLDVKNFPLHIVSRLKPTETRIKTGQIDSSIKGSVKQTKVDSEIVFIGRDIALEKSPSTDGKKKSAWFGGITSVLGGTGVAMIAMPGTNETVPIKVDLSIDYKKQSADQQANAIRRAFTDAVTRAVTDATTAKAQALAGGAIGTVTDAGGAIIGGAGDVVGGAGKAAGDVVGGAGKAAGDAVKGVGGALGGLLGGGKKDEKKDD